MAIGTLGGTISMTSAAGSDTGVVPRLAANELVAAVTQLAEHEITAHTLRTLPGASLGEADLRAALLWADKQVRDGAAGIVLVQGTDTLEETAYFADLWWHRDAPLVVTGAMRPPEHASADGAANLLAAVTTASCAGAAGRGVLVVLNDEVHAALHVAKRDSMSVAAFCSPSFGPVGRLVEGDVVFAAPPARQTPLTGAIPEPGSRVALLTTHLGDDGRLLELVAEDGYDGVVVAALGVGHVSGRFADVLTAVVDQLPIVFTTRTGAGPTWTDTYGFPGSEQDLVRRGAMAAGWLSPPKARVLLSSLVSLGFDRQLIADEFVRRATLGRVSEKS